MSIRKYGRGVAGCAALMLALLATSGLTWAEDEAKTTGWFDTAELSAVFTSGNSESSSFGFKNVLERKWQKSIFLFRVGGIRVESEDGTRSVTCLNPACSNFSVVEPESVISAENWYANLRYSRDISERFFWYVGANWDRNRFAGIDDRYIAEAGVGNTWYDNEKMKFKTGYAATYTDQTDVTPNPDFEGEFAGLRFTWIYSNKLTKTTTYTNLLIVDFNLDETQDWRGDMDQGVSVTMTKRLALKVGWRLLYDNLPSVENLTVVGGGAGITEVPVPLDEWDSILTAGLVVNFD